MKSKKVAIVHDWLSVDGGAEVVLKYMLKTFPGADIYTILDTLPDEHREYLRNHKVFVSSLGKCRFLAKRYKYFMPFMPYLIEQFDLSEYDLVISSSHFVAKGVLTHPEQLHIGYIYSPVRYAWDLYHEYNRIGALGKGLRNSVMKLWLHKLRIWDFTSANRPDFLLADSKFIANRISKVWRRESSVIYPPVETQKAIYSEKKEEYYVTLSRLVEYKRIDIIVEAFNAMPNKKLIVIGEGRKRKSLEKIAKENIEFTGYLDKKEAMQIISKAKGFIFMPKEDFGIVPIEAQACGTPVIAYGAGGALETVQENSTGIFVKEQNAQSLQKSIKEFETMKFDPQVCKEFATKFSTNRFQKEFLDFIEEKL